MKMKRVFSTLARFALFSAVTLAVLFGLPALAERHPMALLLISLAVLILVTAANFKAAKESEKPKASHRRTVRRTHHKAA